MPVISSGMLNAFPEEKTHSTRVLLGPIALAKRRAAAVIAVHFLMSKDSVVIGMESAIKNPGKPGF